MEKEGNCKLCNKKDKFLKSHIIPKTFYDIDQGLLIVDGKSKFTKKSPIGIYDLFLCCNCEEYFNNWDDYGINIFREKKEIIKVDSEIEFEVIKSVGNTKIDLQKAKLFFLSLLWRAYACNHSFFEGVSLGNKHALIIKNILLNKTELELSDYSVLITKYKEDAKGYEKLCYNPMKRKISEVNFYEFHLGQSGYQIYIKVDSRILPEGLRILNLGFNKHINVIIDDVTKKKYLLHTIKNIQNKKC